MASSARTMTSWILRTTAGGSPTANVRMIGPP
jgi:hypothetical protein